MKFHFFFAVVFSLLALPAAELRFEPVPAAPADAVPPVPPRSTPGMADGVLTRDGRPFYYMGTDLGGGQWQLSMLWLTRLQGYSMLMVDWSSGYRYTLDAENNAVFRPQELEASASALGEIARMNLAVEFDYGNNAAKVTEAARLLCNTVRWLCGGDEVNPADLPVITEAKMREAEKEENR